MHKPMKPPFSYYGGKQRMASKIIPLLPQHTVYVEPFCGSAAIMFKKPWPEVTNKDHYREVINDSNMAVVNFFRTLQDPCNGPILIEKLRLELYSKHLHGSYADADISVGIDGAVAFWSRIMSSFGNSLGGKGSGGCGWQRSRYSRNSPVTRMNVVDRLPEYLDRMLSTYVECDDALTIIKQWDSPQTMFYLDPPYPSAHQGHYSGYTSEDFDRLVSALDSCQGSFVLSNYDQPGVPVGWERFDFSARQSISKVTGNNTDRKRTECVWRRFNTTPVRPEIQALYDSGKFDCFVPRPEGLPYGI